MATQNQSLVDRLKAKGMPRRDFLKIASLAAASLGLPASFARAASQAKRRPSVIWLHFQECTGCTESLLSA